MDSNAVLCMPVESYNRLRDTAAYILCNYDNLSPVWVNTEVRMILAFKNCYPNLGSMFPNITDSRIRRILLYTENSLDILVAQVHQFWGFDVNIYYKFTIMMKTIIDYILIQQSVVYCETWKMDFS
jgi:hypothetical protein